MLVGIISDTHNRSERTRNALDVFQGEGVEAILHCGDITQPAIMRMILETKIPSYFVFGNNDDPGEVSWTLKNHGGFDLGYSGIITLADRRIGMAHGDRPALAQKVVAQEPDFFLFGHTHQATDFKQGRTWFINPGALHRASRHTFVTLDLAAGKLNWHELTD